MCGIIPLAGTASPSRSANPYIRRYTLTLRATGGSKGQRHPLTAASPAAPDAAPAPPSHRMPIEPSLEADRQEFPPLFDGPDVLLGCAGQQAVVEAAETFAGGNHPDPEVRQHAADREPQAADIIGEVGRIYRMGEEAT